MANEKKRKCPLHAGHLEPIVIIQLFHNISMIDQQQPQPTPTMALEDDEMSVASLTPSVASYMSSWSMPAGAPSRSSTSTSRGASSNTSGSRRRAGRYGHRVAVTDDNCDAASTTFHSRRLRRSPRRPRVRDVEEGGASASFQQQDKDGPVEAAAAHAWCIGPNDSRLLRPRGVIPVILAIVASVALFSTHPAPTYYRRLICDVVFDYSGYAGYSNWEDLVRTCNRIYSCKKSVS